MSTPDDDDKVSIIYDFKYNVTLLIISRAQFLCVHKSIMLSLQQDEWIMNYIACMLQTEFSMESFCFEILQVSSVFDLIISHIIENYFQI